MTKLFKLFSFKSVAFLKQLKALIDYSQWQLLRDNGSAIIKNNGSDVSYNANVFSGQGLKLNGVDQSISTIDLSGATATIYTFDGNTVYLNSVLDITSILPTGIYQNIIYLNQALTQQEQDNYTNSPETFLYKDEMGVFKSDLSFDVNKVVYWLPLCENSNNVVEMLTNTTYQINNYLDTSRTQAQNLSYGLQTAKIKRDMLGKYLYKSEFFESDGISYADTQWLPSSSDTEFTMVYKVYVKSGETGLESIGCGVTEFRLGVNNSPLYAILYYSTISGTKTISKTGLVVDSFNTIVIRYTTSICEMFINGVNKGNISSDVLNDATQSFTLGATSKTSYHVKNPTAKFQLHKKLLTDEEIQAI